MWKERFFMKKKQGMLQNKTLRDTELIRKKAEIGDYFGEYRTKGAASFITGFVLDENELCIRTTEGEYCFSYSDDDFSSPETVRDNLCCCGKATLQPDGSLYLCERLTGESVGMLHIVICKKEEAVLYLRKVAEYVLPQFNGFFDARCIS